MTPGRLTRTERSGDPGRDRRRRHRRTGRRADVGITDGRITEIGDGLAGDRVLDAVGPRRGAGLHRHPHPLRRPGLLGPGADAVVLPRRHHRGRRQLRVLDRADPARAPRADRPHARERRGHGRRRARRPASRGTFATFPEYLDVGRAPRLGLNFARLHRPHRAAPVRDGRRRLRAGGHRRGDRARCSAVVARGASTPAPPGSPPASPSPTAAPTASRCRSRFADRGRGRGAARAAAARRGRGVVAITPGELLGIDDMYELQPERRACRSPTPRCSRSPTGSHSGILDVHRGRLGRGRRGVAAGDAAARSRSRCQLAEPFTLNVNAEFAELMDAADRGAHARPTPTRRGGPRRCEALGSARRSCRAGTPTRSAESPPTPSWSAAAARRSPPSAAATPFDVAARPRARRARDPVAAAAPRQRRRRRRSPAARRRTHVHARPLRRRRPRRPAVRRLRRPPTCSATGCATGSVMPLERRGPQAHAASQADLYGFADRGVPRARAWPPTSRCSTPPPSRPGRSAGCATSPPTPSASPPTPPVGMRHVLVNGTPIRVDGENDFAARPGRLVKPTPRARRPRPLRASPQCPDPCPIGQHSPISPTHDRRRTLRCCRAQSVDWRRGRGVAMRDVLRWRSWAMSIALAGACVVGVAGAFAPAPHVSAAATSGTVVIIKNTIGSEGVFGFTLNSLPGGLPVSRNRGDQHQRQHGHDDDRRSRTRAVHAERAGPHGLGPGEPRVSLTTARAR